MTVFSPNCHYFHFDCCGRKDDETLIRPSYMHSTSFKEKLSYSLSIITLDVYVKKQKSKRYLRYATYL